MYLDKTLRAYLDALASSEPTPGGGSTAALVGALAAALVSMVCRLTVGKRRYRDVEPQMQAVLGEAEALRQRLQDLMGQDAAAYGAVMRAYRLPSGSPQEEAQRQEALQIALREATLVPLAIAEGCAQTLELALPAAELGNPWAVSDAGAAALLAEAALHAALLNVRINLPMLADAALADDARRRLTDLEARAAQKAVVLEIVGRRMAG